MVQLKINSSNLMQQKNSFFGLLFLLIVLNSNTIVAQVKNYGPLYVHDGGSLFVSGDFTFGSGSTTATSRTSTYGKLLFNSGAIVSGAASAAGLFNEGFVGTKSTSYITLPTGQTSTYAPIGVTKAAGDNGVYAAYYIAAPSSVGATLASTVSALPATGYWVVEGDNATLTMIWNSSIASLTSSIANVTVAGYNTSTSKWEAIESETPTGSLTSGTIATTAALTLATYSAFTLAKKGVICAELVAASINTRTWNGTAWDTEPTLADAAVLTGNYPSTAGPFVCNSLDIGANTITLIDGQTIEVVNGITGSGTITMSSTAGIVQRNDVSTIDPPIALTKSTRTGMYANDYIYWGSPLTTNSFSQLSNAQAYNNANTLATGISGAFDRNYKFISGASGGWVTNTSTTKGVGFIMRIKSQTPFSSTINTTDHINLTFTGATNNGLVEVPITNIVADPTSPYNFNLLANPYPSAIDADKFLEYNTDLDGVIYIWKAQTANPGALVDYTSADYIASTRAGSTAEPGIGSTVFNGKIATGQGFKVKAMTTSGTGTAFFNNCMRISGNNDQFYKTNGIIDRYKLNLTGTNGVGNQILVAYMPETTLGYDRMYDAELNSVSPAQLYSTTEDAPSIQLGINARPAFETTDIVSLGVSKANTTLENFTIAISNKEGVFATNTISIYLLDTVLNTYHNLALGNYSFSSNVTDLKNRFKIVYQYSYLNNIDFESNNVVATINNDAIKIVASLPIKNVSIYDISGRLVTEIKGNNQTTSSSSFPFAEGIYIVKITFTNGTIATQKLAKKSN